MCVCLSFDVHNISRRNTCGGGTSGFCWCWSWNSWVPFVFLNTVCVTNFFYYCYRCIITLIDPLAPVLYSLYCIFTFESSEWPFHFRLNCCSLEMTGSEEKARFFFFHQYFPAFLYLYYILFQEPFKYWELYTFDFFVMWFFNWCDFLSKTYSFCFLLSFLKYVFLVYIERQIWNAYYYDSTCSVG